MKVKFIGLYFCALVSIFLCSCSFYWPIFLVNNTDAPVELIIKTTTPSGNAKLELSYLSVIEMGEGVSDRDFRRDKAHKLTYQQLDDQHILVKLPEQSTTLFASAINSFPDVFEEITLKFEGKEIKLNRDELKNKLRKAHFFQLFGFNKKYLYLRDLF